MSLPAARIFAVLLTLLTLLAGNGVATEIAMKNGTTYSGVTILRRDASRVECQVKYGKLDLATAEIATIDGVALNPPKPPTTPPPPPATELSKASPAVQPPTLATGSAAPAHSPEPGPPSPAANPKLPTPKPTARLLPNVQPVMVEPVGLDDILWYLTLACGVGAWIVTIRRVKRISQESPHANSRVWLLAAIFLPFVGYLLFEVVRLAVRQSHDPQDPASSIHEFVFLDADHQPVMIEIGELGSGLENAKGILQAAIIDRASDVHIEPGSTEYRVRFRIDGVLHPRLIFPSDKGLRLVSALKNVAQLDISERRKAQDGRFGGRSGGKAVDFRAATASTVHGEKLVLRILDQKSGVRGLADLGMSQQMMERFADIIQFRSGMILATGPTGSGKTSSLYAALTQLDTVSLNIVTIEDPVEYELSGATQIPVNVKAGVTYESGLRSILRQDPDVILVGEMRDLEAAQIALRSALTGHLVFSSLHSRDAVGTIHRLEEMGIERHLLASALLVVLSQRLVRVLCLHCRRATVCSGKELAEIDIELPSGGTIYEPVGCKRCDGSGYAGRTGLFEMLTLSEALRKEINDGASEDIFTKMARSEGYCEYREDGAEKVLRGITSVDEVLKAI